VFATPGALSRLSLEAIIEPRGNARAAAIRSRSGVFVATSPSKSLITVYLSPRIRLSIALGSSGRRGIASILPINPIIHKNESTVTMVDLILSGLAVFNQGGDSAAIAVSAKFAPRRNEGLS
jgi:hypothetical protein